MQPVLQALSQADPGVKTPQTFEAALRADPTDKAVDHGESGDAALKHPACIHDFGTR